jgi:glutathione S-transferase
VAIVLDELGFDFETDPISQFRGYDTFASIHPAVKPPTLVLDDGIMLTDSSMIIEYARAYAPRGDILTPSDPARRVADMRLTGLAMAIYEDTWFVMYETVLRPEEKSHKPWVERTEAQLGATLDYTEQAVAGELDWLLAEPLTVAAVSLAVGVSHRRRNLRNLPMPAERYPNLHRLAETAEATDVFRRYAASWSSDIETQAGIAAVIRGRKPEAG